MQEIVGQQSFADGSSYQLQLRPAPRSPTDNPDPAIVGGGYVTTRLGRSGAAATMPGRSLPTPGNPGSPCYPQTCPLDQPDDFLNWVYQQTPGPVEIIDPLGRTTTLDYCDPIAMAAAAAERAEPLRRRASGLVHRSGRGAHRARI